MSSQSDQGSEPPARLAAFGLCCKRCGQVFGVIMTPIETMTQLMVLACCRCLYDVTDKPAVITEQDWQEVLEKLQGGSARVPATTVVH